MTDKWLVRSTMIHPLEWNTVQLLNWIRKIYTVLVWSPEHIIKGPRHPINKSVYNICILCKKGRRIKHTYLNGYLLGKGRGRAQEWKLGLFECTLSYSFNLKPKTIPKMLKQTKTFEDNYILSVGITIWTIIILAN